VSTATQLVLPDPLCAERAGWPYITVVSVSGYSHVTEAANLAGSTFRWYLSWGYSEFAGLSEEGVVWIRGWHERESDEVRALLAAWKLWRSAA